MLNPGDRVTAEELYKILLAVRLADRYVNVVGGRGDHGDRVALQAAITDALKIFEPMKLGEELDCAQ